MGKMGLQTLLYKASAFIMHVGASVVVAPYRFFYHENTRDPIRNILNLENQNESGIKEEVDRWLKLKLKEALYTQAAVSLLPHFFFYFLIIYLCVRTEDDEIY